jgi:hypothetical protein
MHNFIQMPCGKEMIVSKNSNEMYLRMHKKVCKLCPKDAKPIIFEAPTGEELGKMTTNPSVNDPTVLEIATQKMLQMQSGLAK